VIHYMWFKEYHPEEWGAACSSMSRQIGWRLGPDRGYDAVDAKTCPAPRVAVSARRSTRSGSIVRNSPARNRTTSTCRIASGFRSPCRRSPAHSGLNAFSTAES